MGVVAVVASLWSEVGMITGVVSFRSVEAGAVLVVVSLWSVEVGVVAVGVASFWSVEVGMVSVVVCSLRWSVLEAFVISADIVGVSFSFSLKSLVGVGVAPSGLASSSWPLSKMADQKATTTDVF